MNNMVNAAEKRRSRYGLSKEITVSEAELKEMIERLLVAAPSPMNNQSTRLIVLMGDESQKMWEMTLEEVKKVTSGEKFPETQAKFENAFLPAYGTILFYEDQKPVDKMKEIMPAYAHNFDNWSQQTNAMLQFALWAGFADIGIGASMQHYNELIADRLKEMYDVPEEWNLIAQMPFGVAVDTPDEKEVHPVAERLIFK